MDSLTQAALGAAVGSTLMGRKAGARAPMWGVICGTIPDLDVVIPMGEAVAGFTYHRSFSHSLFVLAALTPLLVWLVLKFHPQTRVWRTRWAVTIYLIFATHVLLDSMTVYGTQIFWPVTSYPVSIGSIFIIDPLYTVPLLVGVAIALVRRHDRAGWRAGLAGLMLSTLYLAWGVAAQAHVTGLAQRALQGAGLNHQHLLVQPTPFNSILWRVVAMDGDKYHVGYYSLADSAPEFRFRQFASATDLLTGLQDHWPVERLQWFTHGFFAVSQVQNAVVVTDLRMGVEPDYVFRFRVADHQDGQVVPVASTRLAETSNGERTDRLPALWRRIWGDVNAF